MTADELSSAIRERDGGCVVSCHVQPKASRTAVVGMYAESLKVALKSPPVDGKANKELCRFFAALNGVANSSVTLLSGETSRSKRIFVPVSASSLIRRILTDE